MMLEDAGERREAGAFRCRRMPTGFFLFFMPLWEIMIKIKIAA